MLDKSLPWKWFKDGFESWITTVLVPSLNSAPLINSEMIDNHYPIVTFTSYL